MIDCIRQGSDIKRVRSLFPFILHTPDCEDESVSQFVIRVVLSERSSSTTAGRVSLGSFGSHALQHVRNNDSIDQSPLQRTLFQSLPCCAWCVRVMLFATLLVLVNQQSNSKIIDKKLHVVGGRLFVYTHGHVFVKLHGRRKKDGDERRPPPRHFVTTQSTFRLSVIFVVFGDESWKPGFRRAGADPGLEHSKKRWCEKMSSSFSLITITASRFYLPLSNHAFFCVKTYNASYDAE